jgi:phosphate transport system substrate-binding protein
LYQHWIEVYPAQLGRLSYDPVGSGKGIDALLGKKVDFGGTDDFLTDRELKRSGNLILHVPTCVGAVAVSYNLPGNPELALTPELIAGMFMGKITRWNDRRISEANPGAELPDLEITVLHRSDSSGTTAIFTGYLAKTDPAWDRYVGQGRVVRWPVGLGLNGNVGVVQYIKKIPGSIGYVEFSYTRALGLSVARVSNRAGHLVPPSSAAAAALAGVQFPEDLRVSLTDSPAPEAYPIAGFSYLIVRQEQAYAGRSRERALALARFLWWAVHEGQAFNEGLYYGSLPPQVVRKAEVLIRSLHYEGRPLVDW